MRILKSRLAELAEQEREAELAKERGDVQNIGFGGEAVRHYVLHPYQQVKDERTGLKIGNTQARPRRRARPVHPRVPARQGRRKGCVVPGLR